DDAAYAVHVTGHDMSAQLLAGLECALQVDAPTGLPRAQRRAAQRLVGDVDLEDAADGRGSNLGGREAGAVAGDRGPDREALGLVAAADREAPFPARQELADIGDEASEHGRSVSQLSSRP